MITMLRNEFFIARRMYFEQHNGRSAMSRPAIRVALIGIVIGIIVMTLTIFIALGFKQAVRTHVSGFASDIRIQNFDNNYSANLRPITIDSTTLQRLTQLSNIQSAEPFITQVAMLKTNSEFQGIIMRGLTLADTLQATNSWEFMRHNLEEGCLPSSEKDILISRTLQNLLGLNADTTVLCYFISQDKPRVRKLHITGIYDTHNTEFDKQMVICDIRMLQQVLQYSSNQVAGIDLHLHHFSKLEDTDLQVYRLVGNQTDPDDNYWQTQTLIEQYPAIFSWLELLDMDVYVIIILMLIVSGFNIISGLLILILDNIRTVGILKALGANNRFVGNVFVMQSAMLLLRGLAIGNIIAICLAAIQYFMHVVPLDASTYYINYVPVSFAWGYWILLNLATIIVSVLIMLLPAAIVRHISPSQVMHFE